MDKYQTGDKVIIIGIEGRDNYSVIGSVCCVTGPSMYAEWYPRKGDAIIARVYPVDLPPPVPVPLNEFVGFREEHLKPFYDGDSREVAEWDTDLFQPTELIRVGETSEDIS